MGAEYTDDPYIHCPACDQEYRDNDAWELKQGCVTECPKCGVEIECTETDVRRSWIWSTKAEGGAQIQKGRR